MELEDLDDDEDNLGQEGTKVWNIECFLYVADLVVLIANVLHFYYMINCK
jgi:hypothetical protein